MDSDDLSTPERLAKVVGFFEAQPDIDIVGSFVEEFDDSGASLGVVRYPTDHESMRRFFLRRNPVAHASVAQRAASFLKTGPYVRFSVRNEDTLLWLSAFRAGVRFANIPEVLYRVRFTEQSSARRTGVRKAFSDLLDRLRVIVDLGGGWSDAACATGLFLLQLLPGRLYRSARATLVRRKRPT
jgi:hypothetical protein